MDFEEIGINWIFKFFFYHLRKKNCSEGKEYPGTELERKKKLRQLFLEFLFGIAEKRHWRKRVHEEGEKNQFCKDDMILKKEN